MKKLIDKRIIKVSILLMIMGVISGIVFFLITSGLDKMIVKNELLEYTSISNIKFSFSSLVNSFKYNIIYVIVITICSVMYLFSPVILFVNYYKGLVIGFLVSSFVYSFKLKGILYSLVSLFPHHIIMCIFIIVYSSIMFNISLKLIRGTFNKESINLSIFVKKIVLLFIIGLFICFVSSILELVLNNYLINLVIDK